MKKSAMIPALLSFSMLGFGLYACSSSDNGLEAKKEDPVAEEEQSTATPVDYSLGRAMNKRLGKGINLGNAWDGNSYWGCGTLREDDEFVYTVNGETKTIKLTSADQAYLGSLPAERYNFGCEDRLDASWGNPIEDSYFQKIKDAGFNSVRIPVKWQHNSNPETHTVNPERLAGVLEDVKLAIDAGLAVVMSFHWYHEIMFAADHAVDHPDLYESEKLHYFSIWSEVAQAFNIFPDTMLVFDILNEPTMKDANLMNEVMTLGYNAIRQAAPGKTIMFEAYHAAKFYDLDKLKLPQDGNIIYSGHYYEPFNYSHQGHSTPCVGDEAYANTANADLRSYKQLATKLYPDVNGGHVPMNMGEFGISGGGSFANDNVCNAGQPLPSAKMKARWAQVTIQAAEKYDISWHYWGFTKVGGFEAYDKAADAWYTGFPDAFFPAAE